MVLQALPRNIWNGVAPAFAWVSASAEMTPLPWFGRKFHTDVYFPLMKPDAALSIVPWRLLAGLQLPLPAQPVRCTFIGK